MHIEPVTKHSSVKRVMQICASVGCQSRIISDTDAFVSAILQFIFPLVVLLMVAMVAFLMMIVMIVMIVIVTELKLYSIPTFTFIYSSLQTYKCAIFERSH